MRREKEEQNTKQSLVMYMYKCDYVWVYIVCMYIKKSL